MADSYGNVTAEYMALRDAAGLVADRREVVWARGPDAVSFLDGQLSQDIAGIAPGGVARSLLLEPRGKLRAVLWVLAGEGRIGLVADAGRGATVLEDLERFRFRVDVALEREASEILEVWGPAAERVLRSAGIEPPTGWAESDGVVTARLPLVALPRFLVIGVDAETLVAAGASRAGVLATEAVRIEGGEPVAGTDVDETTIPQESGLVEESVSFTKGCFLGQELVARIDARGHVNRRLRGIVLAENVIPPPGSEIVFGDDTVGTLTSVAESLTLRAPIGLALVRREVEPGAEVTIRWGDVGAPGRIEELPLDDFARP
jgi:folate-binding protein YgfZ